MDIKGGIRDSPAPLNWSDLPEDFHYLIEAAEKYGPLYIAGGGCRRKLKRKEVGELAVIADQITLRRHDLPLQSWVSQNLFTSSRPLADLIEGVTCLCMDHGFELNDPDNLPDREWLREQWASLDFGTFAALKDLTREVFSHDEALAIVITALERLPTAQKATWTYFLLHPYRDPRSLDWIESHPPEVAAPDWSALAALSSMDWSRVVSWLEKGRPLSLIALGDLKELSGRSDYNVIRDTRPKLLAPASLEQASRVLSDYAIRDPAPRVKQAVAFILDHWSEIVRE